MMSGSWSVRSSRLRHGHSNDFYLLLKDRLEVPAS